MVKEKIKVLLISTENSVQIRSYIIKFPEYDIGLIFIQGGLLNV